MAQPTACLMWQWGRVEIVLQRLGEKLMDVVDILVHHVWSAAVCISERRRSRRSSRMVV